MVNERNINKGDIYRHFKNKLYQVVAVAYHSETGEKYVVYQALYGDYKTYIRPYDMFMSEVDHVKYPKVSQKYRFEKVILNEKGEIIRCEDSDESIEPDCGKNDNVTSSDPSENDELNDIANPCLLEFLDKENSRERIEYINAIRNKVDNRLISDIAAALDLTIEDGDTDDRFRQLINCLKTMARFECERLR